MYCRHPGGFLPYLSGNMALVFQQIFSAGRHGSFRSCSLSWVEEKKQEISLLSLSAYTAFHHPCTDHLNHRHSPAYPGADDLPFGLGFLYSASLYRPCIPLLRPEYHLFFPKSRMWGYGLWNNPPWLAPGHPYEPALGNGS